MKKIFMTSVASLVLSSYAFAAVPTDAQIEKIVMDTNSGEVALARVAQTHAQNSEVKSFANHMIEDHTANNMKSQELAAKLNLTPADSDKTVSIKKDGSEKLTRLKKLKGKDFDLAYMDSQVKMHRQVLNDLDQTLIPAAQNSELRAMLVETKSKVEEHLGHATKIQKKIMH